MPTTASIKARVKNIQRKLKQENLPEFELDLLLKRIELINSKDLGICLLYNSKERICAVELIKKESEE